MDVEHELCGNCKKEIPQHNYVMHTAHCARNITLCTICKEPIPKNQYDDHRKSCQPVKPKEKKPEPLPTTLERSQYFQDRKLVEDRKIAARKERQLAKLEKFVDVSAGKQLGHTTNSVQTRTCDTAQPTKIQQNGANKLLACKYCELELPKLELDDHENYCGSRTDRCLECGELVMFKYKQIHMDTNHNFLKLKDEPGPRASWDSTTQRSNSTSPRPLHRRPSSTFSGIDTTLYSFPSTVVPSVKDKGADSYKEISRRLDCKTEYIRNLLHDSASITVPLRHNGAIPRNHFNHNKAGPAPQPPLTTSASPPRRPRRPNPPTELTIPCEFCDTPIPHNDLIQHETGCRPDLARYNPQRSSNVRRSQKVRPRSHSDVLNTARLEDDDDVDDDGYEGGFAAAALLSPQVTPLTPEVELPCEFCSDLIPASQLLRHQATCN